MCSARHLRLSTSEISDVTASMPSLGYFALQHRVAPPRKAYSLTSSAFLESGTPCPFLLFAPVFRGDHNNPAIYGTRPELPPDSSMNASYSAWEQQNNLDFNRNPVFP